MLFIAFLCAGKSFGAGIKTLSKKGGGLHKVTLVEAASSLSGAFSLEAVKNVGNNTERGGESVLSDQ